MANASGTSKDEALSREIQLFATKAVELAKAVVDGRATEEVRGTARDLAGDLRDYSNRARAMGDQYRASALKALADARLDLAFAAAGGNVPSSTRIGWYIQERESGAKASEAD